MSPSNTRLKFWRHTPLRAQLLIGFILPVVLILMSSWAVYESLETALEQSSEVENSIRSITLRDDTLNAVLDAETGERGFVITGKPEFLEPYYQAQLRFSRATRKWLELSPASAATVERIDELFQRWLRTVARPVIAARQEAPDQLMARGFQALQELDLLWNALKGPEPTETGTQALPALEEFTTTVKAAALAGAESPSAEQWDEVRMEAENFRQLFIQAARTGSQTALMEARANAEQLHDQLQELTYLALEAENKAVALVSSGTGKVLIDEIRAEIAASTAREESRLTELSAANRARMKSVERLALVLPVASVLLGIILMFLMQSDTLKSIAALRAGARRVARGELDARIEIKRSDELGGLAESFNQMATELGAVQSESQALDRFQSMLTSSQTQAEGYAAAARTCRLLLPRFSGALYAIAASRNLAEAVQSWGEYNLHATVFPPADCRALRVGRLHCADSSSVEVFCRHVTETEVQASACIPLMSRDESFGSLYLALPSGSHDARISPEELSLAHRIADRLALALSNLRLAQELRAQSIQDPLTGLFNRRYLDPTLDRELANARRYSLPLSVVSLDADHFKSFNDRFGHDAGDLVLKRLAEQMVATVRSSDIACRLGGEEFVLVLPGADTNAAQARAEELRQRVAALDLEYHGRGLGSITVSLGVATIPGHADTKETLLRKADAALYRAKKEGRNRVMVADAEPLATTGSSH